MSAPISGMFSFVVDAKRAQHVRRKLESEGLWDEQRRLLKLPSGDVAVPVHENFRTVVSGHSNFGSIKLSSGKDAYITDNVKLPVSKKASHQPPHKKLCNVLQDKYERCGGDWNNEMLTDVPTTWKKHDDLYLLPATAFQHTAWKLLGPELWKIVAMEIGAKRLAIQSTIKPDGMRTPNVKLLLGETGWVTHVDNSIRYCYDVEKCMFSCGNITEKMRVAEFECRGETVVDLYAGIGYFTLPYLVHANAEHVIACEWNPHAVDGLRRGLQANGVENRCQVLQGDNRQVCPTGVADRVNLGLIPSSEEGWQTACRALKPQSGGILHIHGNVSTKHPVTSQDAQNPCKQAQEITAQCSASQDADCESEDNYHKFFQNCDSKCGSTVDNAKYLCTKTSSGSQELRASRTQYNSVRGNDHTQHELRASGTKCKGHSTRHEKRWLWWKWAQETSQTIENLLNDHHIVEWTVSVVHIEHVKAYAPHVDHLVVDLLCKPTVT